MACTFTVDVLHLNYFLHEGVHKLFKIETTFMKVMNFIFDSFIPTCFINVYIINKCIINKP